MINLDQGRKHLARSTKGKWRVDHDADGNPYALILGEKTIIPIDTTHEMDPEDLYLLEWLQNNAKDLIEGVWIS